MKKCLLALFALGLVGGLSAQTNFTITDAGMTNVTGSTQNYWIDQNLMDARHYTITNTSPNNLIVKVRRTIIQLNTPTAVTSFCTDINCYSSTTNMSINVAVSGGGGHFDLTTDYFPDSISGVGHVRYAILDQSNPADSVNVDFIYNTTPAGVQANASKPSSVSLYPNPAASYFNLNFTLGNGTPANSKIVIYNMLGDRVTEMQVGESEGVVKFDVSSFDNGIYFCSLESDGKAITTKRLIVAH